MSKEIELIFDFGSPNAYLSMKAMQPMLERTGATLKITPCLLGGIFKATNNQPPFVAFGGVKGKTDYMRHEIMRYVSFYGLRKFQFNAHFPVNTLMLVRAACAMQDDSRYLEFVNAGLECMWEENLKMDDPDVFAKAFNDRGFDGASLLAATQSPEVKQRLADNTEAAVARGVFGIPTFFIGDQMFFGKEHLSMMEAMIKG